MATCTIRVHYPDPNARLGLRTELDWSTDVPGTPTEDGAVFTFETDQPWLYFKPVLYTAEGERWLPGTNRIAQPGPGVRDIYPSFFSGLAGRLTQPMNKDGVWFRVYLPAGYDENTLKRYPVLYMHDGANLFLPEESFGGQTWDVDNTLDTLHSLSVIDQVIVVGVYTGNRERNYTLPGLLPYADWCANTLRPAIDARFRTLTGPRHTAVFGSSRGGVLALHSAWTWPETFGMAGCLSSSFDFDNDLFQRVAEGPVPEVKVYLDSGWPRDNFESTVAMRDLLLQRGLVAGRDLLYFAFPGATHSESAWSGRVHLPFQWFFARTPGTV